MVLERDGAAEAGDARVVLHGEDEASSGSDMVDLYVCW